MEQDEWGITMYRNVFKRTCYFNALKINCRVSLVSLHFIFWFIDMCIDKWEQTVLFEDINHYINKGNINETSSMLAMRFDSPVTDQWSALPRWRSCSWTWCRHQDSTNSRRFQLFRDRAFLGYSASDGSSDGFQNLNSHNLYVVCQKMLLSLVHGHMLVYEEHWSEEE